MNTNTSRGEADLLVIGAGLSGLMAAWQAARAGLRVHVIAKGAPSLHWTAGTVDVLGYMAAASATAVADPMNALSALPGYHPYSLLGAAQVRAALADFLALTEAAGLPYVQGDGNWLLPSAVGALRPTWLTPQAQAAGDARRTAPMLIVGFSGLRDFYPHLIAENLGKQGVPARAAMLPLELISTARDRNAIHLAHALDEPQRHQALGRALRQLVQPGERIGLPALLGLEDHGATWAALQSAAGAALFEIPMLPPSVPGTRLFQAIRRSLRDLGVRVDMGIEAIRSHTAAGRIEWVETATSARPMRLSAACYLLASGGVLGGGFDSDHTGRVREVVFDLPLTVPQRRSHWFRAEFMHPAGQPVFQGGVAVTAAMQPCHPDDPAQPLYANLWAAGGVLAGADPIQERSLEGIALTSGWAVAQALARR
ncbi:MAG: glycerol-3-phosphate dehydrogenase subunit GlpB [Caldilineales bacterium]